MDLFFRKQGSVLVPCDEEGEKWLSSKQEGQQVLMALKALRNIQFHRKFFKLIGTTYEYWNPGELNTKYGMAMKNAERYRKDLTILAGYYEQYIRLDGSIITEPLSISFAKMDEEEFQKFYSSVVDVILQRVLVGWTMEQVDELIGGFL